jgi:hypothetical protein
MSTIKAIGLVGSNTGGNPVAFDTSQQNYLVIFEGSASDGATDIGGQFANGHGFSGSVLVPVTANFKQSDRLIRQAMAAAILSATSFVIDPDDIYVPFS